MHAQRLEFSAGASQNCPQRTPRVKYRESDRTMLQGASGFASAYIKVKLVLAACLEAGIAQEIFFGWDIFAPTLWLLLPLTLQLGCRCNLATTRVCGWRVCSKRSRYSQ